MRTQARPLTMKATHSRSGFLSSDLADAEKGNKQQGGTGPRWLDTFGNSFHGNSGGFRATRRDVTASAESSVQAKKKKEKKKGTKLLLFWRLRKKTRASESFVSRLFSPPHCTVYQIQSKKTGEEKWAGFEPTYSMCEQ